MVTNITVFQLNLKFLLKLAFRKIKIQIAKGLSPNCHIFINFLDNWYRFYYYI